MKIAKVILKAAALTLAIAILAVMFVGCSGKKVLTLSKDGKEYSMDETEYNMLMKVIKANFYISNGYTSMLESIIWDYDMGNGQTYGEYYDQYVQTIAKTTVAEKYLADKYGLKLSDETLASYKELIKKNNDYYGGMGAYKQYFGYTAKDYFNIYQAAVDTSDLILNYLYKGENAIDPVTDADREAYYRDVYEGYQYIYLDMNQKIETVETDDDLFKVCEDASGNKYMVDIRLDDDGQVVIENKGRVDGTEVEDLTKITLTGFCMVDLTEEEKANKALISDEIAQLADGDTPGYDFRSLSLLFSDDYYSYLFDHGVFITDTGYIVNNDDVMNAARALEVGEHTEAIEIADGKYTYIVKKIELIDKAYEDEKYKDLFANYDDSVMYDKYQKVCDEITKDVVIDTNVAGKYSIKNTYLTPFVDDYYNQQRYSY